MQTSVMRYKLQLMSYGLSDEVKDEAAMNKETKATEPV
jgi:hypothetical protein